MYILYMYTVQIAQSHEYTLSTIYSCIMLFCCFAAAKSWEEESRIRNTYYVEIAKAFQSSAMEKSVYVNCVVSISIE